jgi:hypothetical protein
MSRNGSGTYALPAGNPVVTGTTISSTWANTTLTDIANALTGSVAADGQTAMTGALQMGTNNITNAGTITGTTVTATNGTFANITDSGLTNTRVPYATTGGLLTDSANMTFNGTTLNLNNGVSGYPVFSAYASAATTINNAAWTKIIFDVETFDTNNNFASSRFTPTVAGYYQLSASWQSGFITSIGGIQVYKNGSSYQYGSFIPATSIGVQVGMSNLVYLNGSTDYVEIYGYQATGSSQNTTVSASNTCWFSGCLVRGA